jgi:hypothetical protein
MFDHAALTRIAKAIAADMKAGQFNPVRLRMIDALNQQPEHILDLFDLMAKEGARKRPNENLMGGYAFLLAHGLEQLRYAVERNDAAAIALVGRLQQHLKSDGKSGRIAAPILLLILKQFASAKLDVGDGLRELMQQLMENDAEAQAASERGEEEGYFIRLAEDLGHDPFAIHACLDESAESMPEETRAGMVMAIFGDATPSMREAALGFLLNGSPLARTKLVELIMLATPHGLVTPTMLRRMIAVRNWLPAEEQQHVNRVIKAARKAGITCAPAPRPHVQSVLVSGIDGSGALTVLTIATEGGKPVVAGLLVKQGFGVRDAWVRRGVSPAELRDLLAHVGGEIGLAPSTVDFAALVVRRFLASNLESKALPPFGLLDFAEVAGISDLNPDVVPVEALVAQLCADIDPARLSQAEINKTLRESGDWPDEIASLDSWFEDDVAKAIGTKRVERGKQMAVLLAGPLQARRRRWAELTAWMALSLKHQQEHPLAGADWQSFAIVARELLGSRPLDEIGLMKVVADTTLSVLSITGSRRAA